MYMRNFIESCYTSFSTVYIVNVTLFFGKPVSDQTIFSTVETRYNAVLAVHRSDPRYISGLMDITLYVSPPHCPRMACIRGRSSHIMNIFTI